MKKISIVVPIYNSSLYLDDCIKSIINQSYKNIEIILINDGSVDNSLEICNKYKKEDRRIRVINKHNTGVSDTRNMGINESSGEYIAFIDSDDIINKDYIKHLSNNIDKTKLNVCYYTSIIEEVKKDNNYLENNRKILEKKDFILLSNMRILNQSWGKVYNKKIIVNNKIKFNDNLSLGEDLLFNLEYMKYIDKIGVIDNKLYYYRQMINTSLTSKYRNDMESIQLMLLDKFIIFFENAKSDHIKLYNDQVLNFIGAIVANEYRNMSVNIFKRFNNINSFLKRRKIKKIIIEHKKTNNIIKYLILRYHLAFIYYIYLFVIKRYLIIKNN